MHEGWLQSVGLDTETGGIADRGAIAGTRPGASVRASDREVGGEKVKGLGGGWESIMNVDLHLSPTLGQNSTANCARMQNVRVGSTRMR